jgi:3'(2'), 5'-bisphosphate nucleotidase
MLCSLRADATNDDPVALGRRGDAASHRLLTQELALRFPADAVLSEECIDDGRRFASARTWIIDPLDGTREFCEPGRDDWAVHVALVAAGQLVAAAVALPARHLVLSTGEARTRAWSGAPIATIAVSRTRPPHFASALADRLGAVLLPMGSAGAKAAAVILGDADAYVHDRGQYEWDSAAPVGVASAAGLHASRLDCSPLVYNQRDVRIPDLLICHPGMSASLHEAIATLV